MARIIGVIGASGSGKSRWLKSVIGAGAPKKLLIWDPQDEYGPFGRVCRDSRELIAALKEGGTDQFALVYQPGDDLSQYKWKFDLFCELVYGIDDCCVVIEELADVTTPSWAPPYWSRLSRKGRHRAMTLFGVSQRPALIDKTFLGNCTLVHCCRLNDENDIRVMSRLLGVTDSDVREMRADDQTGQFDWIERNMKTGEVRRS